VIASHFREYVLFGLFFTLVTPLQVVWAVRAWQDNAHGRALLVAGAAANGAIALTWLVTRTVGLPFGPERLEAEAIGVKDVMATADELLIVLLVAALLLAEQRMARPARTIAWVAAAAGLLVALVGGGGH
jgi:hypothetical protein